MRHVTLIGIPVFAYLCRSDLSLTEIVLAAVCATTFLTLAQYFTASWGNNTTNIARESHGHKKVRLIEVVEPDSSVDVLAGITQIHKQEKHKSSKVAKFTKWAKMVVDPTNEYGLRPLRLASCEAA